jgi:hypothetical protein
VEATYVGRCQQTEVIAEDIRSLLLVGGREVPRCEVRANRPQDIVTILTVDFGRWTSGNLVPMREKPVITRLNVNIVMDNPVVDRITRCTKVQA